MSVSLGKKLNLACNYSSSDIILHFFEKVYYPPNSIFHRINYLLSSDYNCIGSTKTCFYNLIKLNSYTKQEYDKKGHTVIPYEPSMAYTKNFWKLRPFHEFLQNDNHQNIASIPFLFKRYNLVLDIPFLLTCIGFTEENDTDFKSLPRCKERTESTSSVLRPKSSEASPLVLDISEIFPDYILNSLKMWKDEIDHQKTTTL